VGAVSFVDEGPEKVLDEFQRDAEVNTLFLATFTYGRGIAGRQFRGSRCPIIGKQEYDTGTFYGGNYATYILSSTRTAVFKGTRATDLGDYDVLQAVLPAARKRGIKTICGLKMFRKDLPNIESTAREATVGQNATTLCFNNPNYRNFLLGIVDDWSHSYEIDGVMWGSGAAGPFANALGASAGGCTRIRTMSLAFAGTAKPKPKNAASNLSALGRGFWS